LIVIGAVVLLLVVVDAVVVVAVVAVGAVVPCLLLSRAFAWSVSIGERCLFAVFAFACCLPPRDQKNNKNHND
jgi:hypothetical protein